ncbi:MAG TPA: hypothetical protein VFM75_11350 [Modicisalibacter sp.]|nr:hypothetical protein [Modicisalibacter sp.]
MMLTIKFKREGEGYQVVECYSSLVVLREGDGDYATLCRELEKAHKEQKALGNEVPEPHLNPHTIICYSMPDEPGSRVPSKAYMYDDDRAWIMNANGKTVATV